MRALLRLIPLLAVAYSSAALAQATPQPLTLNVGGQPNDRSGAPVRTLFQQVQGALNGLLAARGQANGFASLDGNGLVPVAQLPALPLTGGTITSLKITGSGTTGDLSIASATPSSAAAPNTLARLFSDQATAIANNATAISGNASTIASQGATITSQGTTLASQGAAIATKAPLASPTFTGQVTAPSLALTGSGSTGPVDGMTVSYAGQSQALSALFPQMQRGFRVDPRTYGATCNNTGTGDDAGLNGAITALQNAGGGTLAIVGQCVISAPKTITGVPIAVMGDGYTTSQLIGSGTFSGGFLLTLDVSGGSNLTATVAGIGFRTAQAEVANGLKIAGSASGLEERVVVRDLEMRGVNVGNSGFAYGLQLLNTNSPRVSRVTVTGRQSGNGPAGLTNMAVCYDISNTIGGAGGSAQTNYAFSDVRCNAAQRGWNIIGYTEGVFCTRCIAVAVATGFYARPGTVVPLLNVSFSHVDFFNTGFDIQQFAQGTYMGNLVYHRNDSTGPGICYQFANNSPQNQIIGGVCANNSSATHLIGIVWDASNNNIVSDVVLSVVNSGIVNQNGAAGNVYRRGQWINVPSGGGEHGNGGSATNVCIGYNAAC